ncbi:MAG TPA: choice-of-anchor tandem repeat GloVer-containing protein [Terriglobales bacterium]|nr:choice-of-anchor tandem repeat GloVer-containing protein [Terriglobales bacterium]
MLKLFAPGRAWVACSRPILALALICPLLLIGTQAAQSQTLTVLHNFTGGADGNDPDTLTRDSAGNLYGTASLGGSGNLGTAFKLTHRNQGWLLNVLYSFQSEGGGPSSSLIVGPDGSLYGTTAGGGCCDRSPGTVYNLRPPATFCSTVLCPWTETVLYHFTGGADSRNPAGHLTFDQAGNIYGTSFGFFFADGSGNGSSNLGGAAWELVHSGGSWTINVLYDFSSLDGGSNPDGGVTFDRTGNLYGTTINGGILGNGVIFQLAPSAGGWSEQVLYNFPDNGQGALPGAGLVADEAGNFYGDVADGGWVYELTPSGGGWSYSNLYQINTSLHSDLTVDAQGNLYGTSYEGGQGYGFVFKLSQVGGVWTFTDLHDFTGGSDGAYPDSSVVVDANGVIYGTAPGGGAFGGGTVWMLTQ